MEELEKNGINIDFERDIRLVCYEAQKNAPDVTMRRLKRHMAVRPAYQNGVDFKQINDTDEGLTLSARGVIKFSYLAMIEDKLPRAERFMEEYYKLLATRKYGKTAAAIKREVRRMSKDEAIRWIEKTYEQYVRNDMEVFNILQTLQA